MEIRTIEDVIKFVNECWGRDTKIKYCYWDGDYWKVIPNKFKDIFKGYFYIFDDTLTSTGDYE